MDDVDITAEREEKELAARIAKARCAPLAHERPMLDCFACAELLQSAAKASCPNYAACLADWEKAQRIHKITGE